MRSWRWWFTLLGEALAVGSIGLIFVVPALLAAFFALSGAPHTHSQRAVARSQLTQLAAALSTYHHDHRTLPRAPDPRAEGAPWLFAALMPPDAYMEWSSHDVGLLGPEGARPLPAEDHARLRDPGFLARHGPDSPEPLVLLDPWGNPIHYREWASRPKAEKERLAREPWLRPADPERGGPTHDVKDRPHQPYLYDLWSSGPDGRNDYGAACSDDEVHGDGRRLSDCPGGHPGALRTRDAIWSAGALSLLAACGLLGGWYAIRARRAERAAERAAERPARPRGPVRRSPAVAGKRLAGLAVRPSSSASPLRCVFCHHDLARVESRCPACAAVLHEACQAELDGCPTLGCAEPRLANELQHAGEVRRPEVADGLVAHSGT